MAEAAKASSPKPEKKGFDFISLLILLIALINLGALGGVGYYLKILWGGVANLKAEVTDLSLKSSKSTSEAHDEADEAAHLAEVPAKLQPQNLGILYALEGFLINVNSSKGTKYLQTQIELELSDSSVEEEISRKRAVLRDSIILLLSGQVYESIIKPAGMQQLRKDLLRSINSILVTGKVKEVYFTRFHFN